MARPYNERRNKEILDRFFGHGEWDGKAQDAIKIFTEMGKSEDQNMRPQSVKVIYNVVTRARAMGKLKVYLSKKEQ